jgi:hypothetical protein
MRLLERNAQGDFQLAGNFHGPDIPPYAILSHRWGKDGDELTYEEILQTSGKNKAGYAKIKFCGEQAARDGLKYFWVDSCCIRKSSDSELSEALNSMFRWYNRADKCYVYLSDVSIGEGYRDHWQTMWEPAFRKSEWFTRGWTLQELLAPLSIEFFSKEGKLLGDRGSLKTQIHEITDIPLEALSGTPLSHFSVEERKKWASRRQTSRKEDKAYCLLGIFGIFMVPIYGEEENAFRRLEEEINRSFKGELVVYCLKFLIPSFHLVSRYLY